MPARRKSSLEEMIDERTKELALREADLSKGGLGEASRTEEAQKAWEEWGRASHADAKPIKQHAYCSNCDGTGVLDTGDCNCSGGLGLPHERFCGIESCTECNTWDEMTGEEQEKALDTAQEERNL